MLAISTAMRNFGICVPLAVYYFPGTEVLAPILAFSGISIPMNMVFALVTARTLRDPADNAKREAKPWERGLLKCTRRSCHGKQGFTRWIEYAPQVSNFSPC